MARWQGYLASPKVCGASTVVTFNSTELPFPTNGRGLAKFHFAITDSNGLTTRSTGIAANISRVRVKAGGATIYDTAYYPLTEWQAQLGAGGGTSTGQGATSQALIGGFQSMKNRVGFTIPFDVIDARSEDEADICQFPVGKLPSVEITCGASMTSSSFLTCGWTLTDRKNPLFSPVFLGSAMNVASGSSSARVNITEPGLIRAIGLNTQGQDVASTVVDWQYAFKRYRVVLAGIEKFLGTPAVLIESQSNLRTVNDVATATTGIPSMTFLKMVGMLPGPAGSSYMEVDAGAYASGTYTNAVLTPAASSEYYTWALQNQGA